MPNMKAAEKALRQTKKRTAVNAKTTAEIGKLESQIRKAIAAKEVAKAKETWKTFQKRVDKATKTGHYKKSAGARKKSRIASLIAKAGKK